MSFKITIEVPDTKLAAMLKSLNGHKVMVENVQDLVEKPKTGHGGKRPRVSEDTLLTMTGRKPKETSALGHAREVFEKLEKKNGIGNVTLGNFREALVKKSLKKTLAQRCISEKVLSYV